MIYIQNPSRIDQDSRGSLLFAPPIGWIGFHLAYPTQFTLTRQGYEYPKHLFCMQCALMINRFRWNNRDFKRLFAATAEILANGRRARIGWTLSLMDGMSLLRVHCFCATYTSQFILRNDDNHQSMVRESYNKHRFVLSTVFNNLSCVTPMNRMELGDSQCEVSGFLLYTYEFF
jgi:hypothetical protein